MNWEPAHFSPVLKKCIALASYWDGARRMVNFLEKQEDKWQCIKCLSIRLNK